MLKEIEMRHSIRQFENRAVEAAKIKEVLHAGMCAPSARNTLSTRYVVIENRQALDDLPTLKPHMEMMRQVSCAIMVLGERAAEDNDDYLYINASAAIENMLLEAIHQGLSTCWCAIGPLQERIDKFRKYYHLEEHLLPISMIAIGYGKESKNYINEYEEGFVSYIK